MRDSPILYGVKAGQKFAMEIEFKVNERQQFMIKQARTWIKQENVAIPIGGQRTSSVAIQSSHV